MRSSLTYNTCQSESTSLAICVVGDRSSYKWGRNIFDKFDFIQKLVDQRKSSNLCSHKTISDSLKSKVLMKLKIKFQLQAMIAYCWKPLQFQSILLDTLAALTARVTLKMILERTIPGFQLLTILHFISSLMKSTNYQESNSYWM